MPPMIEPGPATGARPPRPAGGRWAGRAGRALAGFAFGAALAEGAFAWRDRGAFPHLNVYEPDTRLGVRLRPGSTERISFAGNPVTSVRINRQGFRGADWPPPSAGETIVLGDSQVFGLGVEEDETFGAQLGRLPGAGPVLNAGVPTYGPPEYQHLLEGLAAERRPGAVVLVINLANELFEAARPNAERHAVWDGWAVRKETAPARVVRFPGRGLLFGRSHAIYALRGYWQGLSAEPDDRGFASEGTWHDLVRASSEADEARALAERQAAERASARAEAADEAGQRAREAQLRLEKVFFSHYPDLAGTDEGQAYRRAHGEPVDIVITRNVYSEAARDPIRTAAILVKGAIARQQIEAAMRERAEGGPDEGAARAIRESLDERAAWAAWQSALRGPAPPAAPRSPLADAIARAKATCDAAGARLLVVALPLDVQVSPDEWRKYGAPPLDMAPTAVLIDDVLAAARAAGAAALDATPALRAAEPGAFLRGDLHMTPRGHRALAGAIAAALAAP